MATEAIQSRQQCETLDAAESVCTPAYILDRSVAVRSARHVREIVGGHESQMLYSVKALPLADIVSALRGSVDGYSVASLNEARLARGVGGDKAVVSYASPVLLMDEHEELSSLCDSITLNSLSQLSRYSDRLTNDCSIGIRINPSVSFVEDQRDDPCRLDSKLGVPLYRLRDAMRTEPWRFANVAGIHFHSNCDSEHIDQLIVTVRHVESELADDLRRFRWFNVGGGYLFNERQPSTAVADEFRRIREEYELDVVFEPGAAIVRSAGRLVASIEDIVQGDRYPIAILDSTVNHWPELFEYQFEPEVEGNVEDGPFTFALAGCSCLAGDLFGVYSFDEPLEIGQRVVFQNAGAYSIAKAHMFNGINLPRIYTVGDTGELVLVKQFGYQDFDQKWGSVGSATRRSCR